MELQAALSALQALKQSCQVSLHTDSEYLRLGITEWLPTWQKSDWRTSQRRPVQNQDLWQALLAEAEKHEIDWHWVRGHAGNPRNERVDRLAREAIPRTVSSSSESASSLSDPEPGSVQLYVRASCQSGRGGWGVVIRDDGETSSRSGNTVEATANEMELRAALRALKTLSEPSRVHVYTVSKYLQQGITHWIRNWKARGWQTKSGQPVRHKELWLELEAAMAEHQVTWHLLDSAERPPESDQAATLAVQAASALEEDSKD